MKRRIGYMALLVLVPLMMTLVSCMSSVEVSALVPAEINLGKYRNMAVASTEEFRFNSYDRPSSWVRVLGSSSMRVSSGVPRDIEARVADYATNSLVNSLQSTGYFNLILPEQTDAYIAGNKVGVDGFGLLRNAGASSLMRSSISYMDCDEYVYTKPKTQWVPPVLNPDGTVKEKGYDKVVGTDYFLVQSGTVSFTYTIVDLLNGSVLASRTFSDKVSRETKLSSPNDYAPSMVPMYQNMIASFQPNIRKQLAPRRVTSTIYLMENKPKLDVAKEAYKQVDQGNLQIAYSMFNELWISQRHIPSGYNAALLEEAMGDLSGAISMMNDVYAYSHNTEVGVALARMKSAMDQQKKAEAQLNEGTSSQKQVTNESNQLVMQVLTTE